MDKAKKERMMKMDRYLSRSAAQNAARQASWMARKAGKEIASHDYHARIALQSVQERMDTGNRRVPHRQNETMGFGRRRRRASRGNLMTVAMIILVLAMIAFLSSSCGAAEDGDTLLKTTRGAGSELDGNAPDGKDADGNAQADGEGSGNAVDDADAYAYEIPEVVIAASELPDNDALAFVRDMKIGWSLGNTLDAFLEGGYANELDSETCWGNVATAKEMIDDISAAGFRTMRVPVTWHGHFVDDDFTISEVWLSRVQEVVDYGIDNGMYIILNIHHDTQEDCYLPNTAHLEQSIRYISAVWTQLSERFADYDEHLIFEGMNEPRLVGSAYEWWIDNNSEECLDAIACINTLNQIFVNTVRAGGGNNGTRYLMVPGYDASPDGALHEDFVLPRDLGDAENRIIVSVHAYTPYQFALQPPDDSGSIAAFDAGKKISTNDIDYFLDRLYDRYTSQGIPVVIGEFGARDKNGNTRDRVDYAAYYIAAARARGITCLWWDNGGFTGMGENFGLYNRREGDFVYPDIVDALMKYAN